MFFSVRQARVTSRIQLHLHGSEFSEVKSFTISFRFSVCQKTTIELKFDKLYPLFST